MFADETGVKIDISNPAICLNLEEHTIILYRFSVRNLTELWSKTANTHLYTSSAKLLFLTQAHNCFALFFQPLKRA